MTRRLVTYVAVAYLLAVTLPMSAHAATTAAHKASATKEHHMAKAAAAPRVNLNTASETDLTALPGIDEATAQKIVSMRPYKSSSQLVSKKIVTKDQFTKIRTLVTARAEKAQAKSAEKPSDNSATKAPDSSEGTTK